MTRIDIATDSQHIAFDSDRIFDYPWLFAQHGGRWQLNNKERGRRRAYLLRGGFLIVDDFHAPEQWQVFERQMRLALAEYSIAELRDTDPFLNVRYDLNRNRQIPGRASPFLQRQ